MGRSINEPSLRTIVLAGTASTPRLRHRLGDRPWVEVIDAGAPLDAVRAMRELHARGIGAAQRLRRPVERAPFDPDENPLRLSVSAFP
jgi:hypothetical protein